MTKILLISALAMSAVLMSGTATAETTSEIVLRSEVQYQPLNPARGDASPQAGVLWGDIKKDVASGAIIKFADGFSSPPHIHNITYRGIVISGAVHNDDPDAEKLWMGPGSFWTQPAGEPHITAAASGSKATIFLEILEGPYLVQPPEEAFDNGERPINMDASNVIWLNSSDVTWIEQLNNAEPADGPKMGFLWGTPRNNEKNGTLLKLPAGFKGELRGNGSRLRAVVIQGTISARLSDKSSDTNLEPGSYFGWQGGAAQKVACNARNECLIYVSTAGRYSLIQK